MNNYLTFLLFATLVFAISCQNRDKKLNHTIQTVQIKPNDKDVDYYDNGQVQFIQQYLNGTKHGKYNDWYKNGQIRTMGYFNLGIRYGIWQWYSENGTLTLQVRYDKQVAQIN